MNSMAKPRSVVISGNWFSETYTMKTILFLLIMLLLILEIHTKISTDIRWRVMMKIGLKPVQEDLQVIQIYL